MLNPCPECQRISLSQASSLTCARPFPLQPFGVMITLPARSLACCPPRPSRNCTYLFRRVLEGVANANIFPTRIWHAFESEIACFFAAWHLPSLKADFRAFFAASQDEKSVTPLGTLSVMLMICALGVMMRASQTEIFGEAAGISSPQEAEVDLTCSRLQSELYRTCGFDEK
jgi:hypothetical protein